MRWFEPMDRSIAAWRAIRITLAAAEDVFVTTLARLSIASYISIIIIINTVNTTLGLSTLRRFIFYFFGGGGEKLELELHNFYAISTRTASSNASIYVRCACYVGYVCFLRRGRGSTFFFCTHGNTIKGVIKTYTCNMAAAAAHTADTRGRRSVVKV